MADHPQALAFTTAEAETLARRIDSHGQRTAFTFLSTSAAPVINNFVPAVGTPLERTDAVRFDVTDDLDSLLRVEIQVKLGNDVPVVVHDGATFVGNFSNLSTRVPITDGFRYSVRRNGGWVKAPVFSVHAVDTDGQEAT